MKLYGTIASERATKGQGGNEFLAIEVTDDEKKILAVIRFRPDGVVGYWFSDHLRRVAPEKIPYKGKKQTGENVCEHGINLNTDDCGLWHK